MFSSERRTQVSFYRDVRNLEVRIDSELLVSYLSTSTCPYRILQPMIDSCRDLLSRFSRKSASHTSRGGNHVADRLANLALCQEETFVIWDFLRDGMIYVLHDDIALVRYDF